MQALRESNPQSARSIVQLTYITTRQHLVEYCAELAVREIPEFGLHLRIEDGIRTAKQNNALHLYYRQLAKALNDGGYDMRRVLSAEIEIPWTDYSTKKQLWVPVQEPITGETSTRKLKRKDIALIYETLTRFLVRKGIGGCVPFPSDEPPMI